MAVHFYPRKREVDKAVKALKAYDIGKPLVVEETFPPRCGQDELIRFIHESRTIADGWFSFYWGTPADELRAKQDKTLGDAINASWYDAFQSLGVGIVAGSD